MKKLLVAESAGFCFGVRRSVEMAEGLLAKEGRCACLGELIHNAQMIRSLEEKGLRTISDPAEAAAGETLLIRAHGVSRSVLQSLAEKGIEVVDATCPRVKAIHTIVSRASEQGRFVLIVGAKEHPEVIGICGWCEKHQVVENAQDLENFLDGNRDICNIPLTIVVQTTQTHGNFTECCKIVKKRCTNAEFHDTICLATSTRQREAAELAARCGAMVVIGGKHSANSIHLSEICREHCASVQFIEKADELNVDVLASADTVGLTAGASVPAWIIKEVRNKMDELNENKVEGSDEQKELSFDEMLEETLKPIYNGEKVKGVVVAITGTEISVDLGTKYSGFIPTSEFTDDGIKVEDAVKVGDEIEAVVVRVNDVEGTAQLSKKRLDAAKSWNDVESAVEDGTILEGVVTEENKGGIVVNVKGVRVFVPASQTDLPREANLAELLKQTVRLKITEVNKARKRVVGSIRRVAQAERRARTESIWQNIEVGKKYHGVVKSLTSYGAFVDIGGIDGMVHVSELSWGRVHQPSEVVSVGDEVDVYVINFDREKRKISLGYKDPEANPWTLFTNQYSVGSVAEVKIVKLMDFGAFAEVLPGVDGLIHISQIANRRIAKPGDVLKVGDVVEAKITAIDEEKHKVSLSIRALSEPAPAPAPEEPAEEETAQEDALVYEVSASGEATGIAPDAE
ncbi:MAG: bifunctional 4-hydroxy-3-methylbut-2-enyl diphosphate reductase/30S ribosomal protein S1 [Oscillospiraceae bacterium]|nr:bifunctional 4-hydroxy-3-methylbut-2-enyl diphosphate reductase/30S ribosomal protein S1 [Oscillospiraceae bacterium]